MAACHVTQVEVLASGSNEESAYLPPLLLLQHCQWQYHLMSQCVTPENSQA